MKRLFAIRHLVVLAVAAATTLMVSCFKDDIIELPSGKPSLPTASEYIAFQAEAQWADEDVISRNAATRNRVGKHDLISEDGELSLPMGVYVEEGICGTTDNGKTRGAVLSAIGNSFTVWASLTNGETTELFFPAEGVVFEDDGTSYKSDPAYFWPGAGTFSFTAVANAPATGFTPNLNTAGTALESFTYTVPADATAQNDIVLATLKDVNGDANATQALNFKHIMSAVNFKVGTIIKGEIRSIKVKNVYNKANYLVDQGVWVLNSEGEFNVTMNGGPYEVTDTNTSKGQTINTADAVLMMIPQVLPEDAVIEIEFHDSETGNTTTYSCSIKDDVWDMGKTTNYVISIGESFNIEIEPIGKLLDAHYIIKEIKVTVDDSQEDQNGKPWILSASIEDAAANDEIVTLMPETLTDITTAFPNHTVELRMIQNGYWCDKYVTRSGSNGRYTYKPNTTSARGTNEIKGTGNVNDKIFYVMIPENNSTYDRNIKITLYKEQNENVSRTLYMTQRCPRWTEDGTYGWETVDDDEDDKYGFLFTRKVDYVFNYTFNPKYIIVGDWYEADFLKMTIDETKTYLSNNIMIPYAPGKSGFYSYVEYNANLGRRFLVRLDYTVLNDIPEADSETEGLENTLALYRLAGKASSIETIMSNTPKTFEGKTDSTLRTRGDNDPSDVLAPSGGEVADEAAGVLDYVLKKNKHYLYKSTETVDFAAPVLLSENDINWYIPADGQFTTFVPNPNVTDINGGTDSTDDYWSSRIGKYDATTVANSEAYRGDSQAEKRGTTLGIIAVRKRDSNTKTGTASVAVDNSSIEGGENGDTNNWL